MDTDTAQAQLMLRQMNICESLASLTATSLVSVSSMSGGQSGEVSGLGAQQDKVREEIYLKNYIDFERGFPAFFKSYPIFCFSS